jgi:hypothetical protein
LPFINDKLCQYFKAYDIFSNKIETPEVFDDVHKSILKSNWKSVKYMLWNTSEENKTITETSKKRIDKEFQLTVINRYNEIQDILLGPVFQPLQQNIFSILLAYNKNINNFKM